MSEIEGFNVVYPARTIEEYKYRLVNFLNEEIEDNWDDQKEYAYRRLRDKIQSGYFD